MQVAEATGADAGVLASIFVPQDVQNIAFGRMEALHLWHTRASDADAEVGTSAVVGAEAGVATELPQDVQN